MKKLRSQQVIIDIPTETGNTWVNAIIQTLIKDEEGNTLQRIDRTHETHRILENVATEMITIVDPVTQQTITVSAAGTATLVSGLIMNWMKDDHGGEIILDSLNNPEELRI